MTFSPHHGSRLLLSSGEMDPLLLVSTVAAAAVGIAAVFLLRKGQVRKAGTKLQGADSVLREIEGSLQPFVRTGDYIPERVRRPLDEKSAEVGERILPSVAKVVRRMRDTTRRNDFERLLRQSSELRKVLNDHNIEFARARIEEHSKLLVDELAADEAQRLAIARDDERNLVIAGAGSGKTRAIVGRIRYLLERRVPPGAILAVTFTNKATEEMQSRLKQMGVAIADRGNEGVTVSTLHALGKRVVQAAASGPISVADDPWTDSLVASVLREAREGRDPRLRQLDMDAILHRDGTGTPPRPPTARRRRTAPSPRR